MLVHVARSIAYIIENEMFLFRRFMQTRRRPLPGQLTRAIMESYKYLPSIAFEAKRPES